MKNYTNIYDIDGELIRAAGDTHEMTLEEAQERARNYQDKLKKLQEQDPTDKRISIYNTYLTNLNSYIWAKYQSMTPEQLREIFKPAPDYTQSEEVQNVMKQLKEELENEEQRDPEQSMEDEAPERTNPGDIESPADGESDDAEIVERGVSDVHEERPITQDDLLVERDGVNTDMDSYVEYEEV